MIRILLPLFLFYGNMAFAQFGPNLTAGAEGLVYKKGELDTQLILDMIATKKGEIKAELGKRLILHKLEGGSYTFYSYAEKNLRLLFGESSKQVITKEFMKNSAELLLVYGMAEYLLWDLKSHPSPNATINNFLQRLYIDADPENKKKLEGYFSVSFPDAGIYKKGFLFKREVNIKNRDSTFFRNEISQYSREKTTHVLMEKLQVKGGQDGSKYLKKPEIILLLDNNSNNYLESRNRYFSAISMFADLVYDVCKTNQTVRATGMFQSNNDTDSRYRALSKYWYFNNQDNTKFIFKTLEGFRPRVDSVVTYLFSYYNLFKEIKGIYSEPNYLKKVLDGAKQTSREDLEKLILSIKDELFKMGGSSLPIDDAAIEKEKQIYDLLLGLPTYMPNVKNPQLVKRYLDIVYSLKKEVLPTLMTINSAKGGKYNDLLKAIQDLNKALFSNALCLFGENEKKIRDVIHDLGYYMPLLEIINNLDRVESYDYMFKFLTSLAETYGDERTRAVVQAITHGVDRYTVIDKEENTITMDVEGMAVDIYEQFSKNQHARLSMLFSVGVSHNIAYDSDLKFLSTDGKAYSQFVSEKIGLKYNLIDWNRRRSFNHYPFAIFKGKKTEMRQAAKSGYTPIVNNLHTIAYTSGLLYKIEALNSAPGFKDPIIGLGAGITFFNGLDLNFSYAAPYSFDLMKGFWSISFDIAITEYLDAFKKKSSR